MTILFHFSGAQKWEVFAQFWEAEGNSTSHLIIDNQLVVLNLPAGRQEREKEKKLRSGKLKCG